MNRAGTLAETSRGREWPTRLTVVLLFFFSSFICYMDRINISVTVLQMEEEFGWGAAQKGLVLSSFFWDYLITQLPGGWLADAMIKRGMSVTATRKILQSVAFGGASIFLLLLIGVKSAGLAITYMTGSFIFGAFGLAAFGVNHLDIGPKYAGILMGITNTAATIPGIFGPIVVGYILAVTGSWTGVFVMIAAVNMIGLIVWNLFATGERILT